MINDRKVKVYVFGAGASVHAGAPLGKDFFSEAFNRFSFPGGLDVDEDKFLKVASYIDELYNINLCAGLKNGGSYFLKYLKNINIEDVLTFIDIELKRKASPDSKKKLQEIQEAFYYFIFSTLEESLKSQASRVYKPRDDGKYDWEYKNCYDKFLVNRIEKSALNVMISFNYDLLLDRALIINNEGVLLDYLINFSDVINFNSYSKRQKNIPFLKLHGSLNWAYCLKCKNMRLYYFQRYKNLLKDDCSCGNKLSPVLIPPTYFKNIKIPQLQGLWEQADKFLRQANEITIIGYSFPDADIKVKWLFKKALAENKNRPNLTIVNPE